MIEKKNEEAIVLLSGGQDSTTCLFWALNQFKTVRTVCITYGQRHAFEVEIARKIAHKAHVSFQVLNAAIIGRLAKNALTYQHIEIEQKNVHNSSSFPNTFVPGRNLFFLTLAAVLAYSCKIRHLVIGVSQADYSGYPDCREVFIRSANTTLNLAMDIQLIIHTPLMKLNKSEIWELANKLGVFELVKNETLTCYNGIIAEGCNECPSCRLRNEGLEEFLKKKTKHSPYFSNF